jgi:ubiquitin carboxyl-terminal hydrolase 1
VKIGQETTSFDDDLEGSGSCTELLLMSLSGILSGFPSFGNYSLLEVSSDSGYIVALSCVLAVIVAGTMFSDTIKGSVDMASASMKYFYDKATTKMLGPIPFDESELTPLEKKHGIERMRQYHVGGLYNEGNTCFMNSVVQSLASLEYLDDFLAGGEKSTHDIHPQDGEWDITEQSRSDLTDQRCLNVTHQSSIHMSPNGRSSDNLTVNVSHQVNGENEQHDKEEDDNITISSNGIEVVDPLTTPSWIKRHEPPVAKRKLAVAVDILIHQLNTKLPNSHTYSTAQLVRSFEGSTSRWSGYDQEDAQEFFQEILLGLEKEIKLPNSRSPTPTTPTTTTTTNTPSNGQSHVVTPFDGIFATRVGCLKCGEMEGIRKGAVSSVDLSLKSGDEFELENLLQEYCSMETISGVECYRCSLTDYRQEIMQRIKDDVNCVDALVRLYQQRVRELDDALAEKVIDEAKYKRLKPTKLKALGDKTKQTMFGLPTANIMMIHINRSVFDMTTGYSRKNYAPVTFPSRLDMSPFVVDADLEINHDPSKPMTPIGGRVMYNLKAAVIHYGSHNFGHYVCYRRCDQGFWWRVSDHSVDLTTEAQVLKAKGVFMLFYERTRYTAQENLHFESFANA